MTLVSLAASFLSVSLVPVSVFLLQAIATEGKGWKRRIEIVIREYHKWRTYFKKRVKYCLVFYEYSNICQGNTGDFMALSFSFSFASKHCSSNVVLSLYSCRSTRMRTSQAYLRYAKLHYAHLTRVPIQVIPAHGQQHLFSQMLKVTE